MIMDIKDTKEGAELIWQLNKVGDYNTHKELWDAYYNLEKLVKNCSIPDVMQWVAVSERLPENEGRYICRRKYKGIVSIENFYPNHPENWLKFTGITHWMQIIEPPCA